MESTLFGINIIMILVLQEKDSVTGEIKYSVIPLAMNNFYLFYYNYKNLASNNDPPSNDSMIARNLEPMPSSPSSNCNESFSSKKEIKK